jgi:hypothetical protein
MKSRFWERVIAGLIGIAAVMIAARAGFIVGHWLGRVVRQIFG